jgi:hypothetical protein
MCGYLNVTDGFKYRKMKDLLMCVIIKTTNIIYEGYMFFFSCAWDCFAKDEECFRTCPDNYVVVDMECVEDECSQLAV